MMQPITTNWRTSLIGVVSAGLGFLAVLGIHVPGVTGSPQELIGYGLVALIGLFAKDAHS